VIGPMPALTSTIGTLTVKNQVTAYSGSIERLKSLSQQYYPAYINANPPNFAGTYKYGGSIVRYFSSPFGMSLESHTSMPSLSYLLPAEMMQSCPGWHGEYIISGCCPGNRVNVDLTIYLRIMATGPVGGGRNASATFGNIPKSTNTDSDPVFYSTTLEFDLAPGGNVVIPYSLSGAWIDKDKNGHVSMKATISANAYCP